MKTNNNDKSNKQLSGITYILDVFNAAKQSGDTEVAKLMAEVLAKYEDDEKIFKQGDEVFRNRMYPTFSLDWSKYYHEVGYKLRQSSGLTRYDTEILFLLCENMTTWNLVQVSAGTLEYITGITKRTIIKSLNQLQYYGCIVVQNKGSGTTPDTYMINPNIMIIGKDQKSMLEKIFWSLTGTTNTYIDGKLNINYSLPHKEWLKIMNAKSKFKVEKINAVQIDNEEWNNHKIDNIPVSKISKIKSPSDSPNQMNSKKN